MNKFKRLSMCNCLTLRMDKLVTKRSKYSSFGRTYTLHLMSLDLFIKEFKPGAKIVFPYKDLWTTSITGYDVPKGEVETFMHSPFNEALNPQILIGKTWYSTPWGVNPSRRNKMLNLLTKTKSERLITTEEYEKNLIKMNQKVTEIYGRKICRILAFYDHTKADEAAQRRLSKFNNIAKKILKWPIVQAKLTKPPLSFWSHYKTATYNDLMRKIEDIEEHHRKGKDE